MEALVPFLIIIAVGVFIGFRIYQQRILKQKKEEYEALLKEARASRFRFIQATQTTIDAQKEAERIEENVTALRAELLGYIQDLRALILSLRAQKSKSTGSDLDLRTIEQMKQNIAEKWAFANTRKHACLGIRAELADAVAHLRAVESAEHEITAVWKEQKDQVMAQFIELRDQIAIPDPKKYFN